MNRKSPKNPLIVFISFILIGIVCIILGFIGLSSNAESIKNAFSIGLEKDKYYKGDIKYCSSCVCEYSHRLNFIIPLGTEYYYIAFSDDQSKAIVVRADKNFYDNFDKDTGMALSTVNSKGKVKKIPNKIKYHFSELKSKINSIETHKSFNILYLDLLCNRIYTMRLISGIGFLVSGFILTLLYIKKKAKDKYNEQIFSEPIKVEKILGSFGSLILIVSIILLTYSIIIM